jgi:hypothetical protein
VKLQKYEICNLHIDKGLERREIPLIPGIIEKEERERKK